MSINTLNIEQFIDSQLLPKMPALEHKRTKQQKYRWILFLIFPAFLGLFFYLGKYVINKDNGIVILISVFVDVFLLVMGFNYLFTKAHHKTFEDAFAETVIAPFVKFINPSYKYYPKGAATLIDFLAMGMFEERNYNLQGNNQIIGNSNGVLFQYCNLYVSNPPVVRIKNEQDDEVFYGSLFVAKFPKNFLSQTFLYYKKAALTDVISTSKTHSYLLDNWHLGDVVKLEDPKFEKQFKVYSQNQIEARYILTTNFMERLKKTSTKNDAKYFISFRDNKIYIANNNRQDALQANISKSVNKKVLLLDYYLEIENLLNIINELQLNKHIWTS